MAEILGKSGCFGQMARAAYRCRTTPTARGTMVLSVAALAL